MEELEGFYLGFIALAETCKRRGIDVPIYVTYFRKKDKIYIIDAPIKYSKLTQNGETKEQIAKRLVDRCNELGKMQFTPEQIEQAKTEYYSKTKKESN